MDLFSLIYGDHGLIVGFMNIREYGGALPDGGFLRPDMLGTRFMKLMFVIRGAKTVDYVWSGYR